MLSDQTLLLPYYTVPSVIVVCFGWCCCYAFESYTQHSQQHRHCFHHVPLYIPCQHTCTSRVDYCNLLLAGAPKSVTDKLQRVMNAAARVVSGTKKYDRGLTHLLHSELHWLDVVDRVTYKLGVTVYKCLHGQAPDYLSELCTPVAQVAERHHLRSTSRHLLVVPRFQLDTYGRRNFAVAGPTTWNLFQNNLREPDMQIDCFRRTLKTCLFLSVLGTLSALEALFATMHYIN